MLISYPVLPAAAVHEDEDIYLANILEGHLLSQEGIYPVSTTNSVNGPVHRWHGGVHLHGGGEPVRAIADGTVVAFRFGAQAETYEPYGVYDTGFILLRHESQTGENTTLVFYSLYMHLANQASLAADRLSQVPTWMRQNPGQSVQRPSNQRVQRKDVLGFTGQLYGREALHFEVFMLDADFERVWRDSTAITQGTGSNDWFGNAHFVIPAAQAFAAGHPHATSAQGIKIADPPGGDHDVFFATPPGVAGQNEQALYVSVDLQRGRRTATTYRATAEGGFEQLGAPVVQDDYEYELYRLATILYADCPSAGVEWLRFGRILGPDVTERNENWQLVRYSATAIGYIDLAPDQIVKLSDADFPHWHGWDRREEGSTTNAEDGICDDENTLQLLQRAATDSASNKKLQHLICKAPTEWDGTDLDVRFAQFRAAGQPLEAEESWLRFVEHVNKLVFWTESGLPQRSVWHFHPLRFVRHFRASGWLSIDELVRSIPRYPYYAISGNVQRAVTTGPASVYQVTRSTAKNRLQNYVSALNIAMRKYVIQSPLRKAHFLAQTILETDRWKTMREYGQGAPNPAIPMAQYYAAFYGRGIMQLTWVGNYIDYGSYRSNGLPNHGGAYSDHRITAQSKHWTASPQNHGTEIPWAPRYDPDLIVTIAHNACDSGGYYWISKNIGNDDRSINATCDRGHAPDIVGRVSTLVNGGGNGYMERQAYGQYLFRYLTDDTSRLSVIEYMSPRGRIAVNFEEPQ